jgi:hypothetical protein
MLGKVSGVLQLQNSNVAYTLLCSYITRYKLYQITSFLKSLLGSFSLGNCEARSCLQDSILFVVHFSGAFLHSST